MKTRFVYTVEYYEQDERFGWTNTMNDKVLAYTDEEALKKFNKHHPNKKGWIVDWEEIDY